MNNKAIIEFGFRMISEGVSYDLGFRMISEHNSSYHTQPHPIIANYCNKSRGFMCPRI